MWERRKLAAIVFTALYYKATAKLLDMAPDAVDDMYEGCHQQAMEKFIKLGLLKQELNSSKGFQKAWSTSTHGCSPVIPGGIKEHTTALLAYFNGDVDFIKPFNKDVERLGVNVSTYEEDFHFKSLHFLLMDSLRLLNPKTCSTLYVLSEESYTAKKGSKVRFGSFTTVYSSYKKVKKMEDLDGQVILNITSCFFATLRDCTEYKDVVLLSPTEVFTVDEVNKKSDADDSEYTEIVLTHSKMDSLHNCYIFSRAPADVSTQWLVLVFVVLSLFFFN
ncbi:ecto-ADP-ribosyltransferase 4 [Pempheris klunzingeri]|uniref:ecto-ADP-ribosyltransferase 4 n=1 Tax=Pempheris klunzingeri TaxID=3127111 RepID=UPI00397ED424